MSENHLDDVDETGRVRGTGGYAVLEEGDFGNPDVTAENSYGRDPSLPRE